MTAEAPADTLLAAVADHLDRLRRRAEHLEKIGLRSAARWLRGAADELEASVTAGEDGG